ncbi:hypothetical protein BHM03_00061504 [Ensete ventricosum]|nr:hypothetical protein BHM03_00061504 [Ensete ventricosum]
MRIRNVRERKRLKYWWNKMVNPRNENDSEKQAYNIKPWELQIGCTQRCEIYIDQGLISIKSQHCSHQRLTVSPRRRRRRRRHCSRCIRRWRKAEMDDRGSDPRPNPPPTETRWAAKVRSDTGNASSGRSTPKATSTTSFPRFVSVTRGPRGEGKEDVEPTTVLCHGTAKRSYYKSTMQW